jgi:hypothetical protein
MTIAREVVDEVKRLLALGSLPEQKIAGHLGIGYTTVKRIRRGEGRYSKPRSDLTAGHKSMEEITAPSGPAVWCEECRATVKMPCVACQLQAIRKKARAK